MMIATTVMAPDIHLQAVTALTNIGILNPRHYSLPTADAMFPKTANLSRHPDAARHLSTLAPVGLIGPTTHRLLRCL